LSELTPSATRLMPSTDRPRPNSPYLEAHYFSNECFLQGLLQNAAALAGIPGVVVQGQYDLLCPPATSYALVQRWPDARIVVAPASGHSLSHPAVQAAVKAAIDSFDGTGFTVA
jgi:proline iminopeptidase